MPKIDNTFSTAVYDVSIPCNFRCIYCRNNWNNNENLKFPDFDSIKLVLEKIAEQQIKRVIYTGGEFFIIPFWKDILVYSSKLNLENWIISNGSCIKSKDISFLEEHVKRINISFHAPSLKLYQKIMGVKQRDIFNKVIENLKLIGSSKIDLGIFFSPIRENYNLFFKTINLLIDKGINITDVNLNRILNVENTAEYFSKEKPLNFFEHADLIRQTNAIRKDLGVKVYLEAYPLCFINKVIDDELLSENINRPCSLGRNIIAINNHGTLKLCPATSFSISKDIRSLNTPLINNSVLKEFSSNRWRNNICKTCNHFELCKGGCHAVCGNVFGDDELIIEDDVIFSDKIDKEFFSLLLALYNPFLSSACLKASVQYTVYSKHKYPIGIIAIKKTSSNANFLEIALIPSARNSVYSFLIMQRLMSCNSLPKYGWTVHKANLPSIKLLKKLNGGFFEKTVMNKKRIEAEGFFRLNASVSKSMQDALDKLLPEAEIKFNDWLKEYEKRKYELKELNSYLKKCKHENN